MRKKEENLCFIEFNKRNVEFFFKELQNSLIQLLLRLFQHLRLFPEMKSSPMSRFHQLLAPYPSYPKVR